VSPALTALSAACRLYSFLDHPETCNVSEASGQAAVVLAWAACAGDVLVPIPRVKRKEGLGLSGAAWPMASPTKSSTGYPRGEHVGGFR